MAECAVKVLARLHACVEALEPVKSALFQWRAPSRARQPGVAPAQPTWILKGTDDAVFTLSDLVTIAFERHDTIQTQREGAMNRAYQLLTFTATSVTFLVGGVQLLWQKLDASFARVVLGLLLFSIYLALKATMHCLSAIMPKHVIEIPPTLLQDGERVLQSREEANTVGLEMLQSIERGYPMNEQARALATEHSALAVQTLAAYAVVVLVSLGVVALGGWTAAQQPPRSPAECAACIKASTATLHRRL